MVILTVTWDKTDIQETNLKRQKESLLSFPLGSIVICSSLQLAATSCSGVLAKLFNSNWTGSLACPTSFLRPKFHGLKSMFLSLKSPPDFSYFSPSGILFSNHFKTLYSHDSFSPFQVLPVPLLECPWNMKNSSSCTPPSWPHFNPLINFSWPPLYLWVTP